MSANDQAAAEEVDVVKPTKPVVPACRSEQVKVGEIVTQLSETEAEIASGPGLSIGSIGMMLIPILVATLFFSGVALGSTITSFACVLGIISVFLVLQQANLYNMERVALQNSQRDKRWMAALPEALEWPDRRVRHIAGRLLTQFLPRLRDSDAYLFDRKRLHCLYRRLSPRLARLNPELTVAILQALPHIGSNRAIPYVSRLASRPAFTRAGRIMRSTARTILPLIEQRAADQRAAEEAERTGTAVNCETELLETERAELEAINARIDAKMQEFEAELRKVHAPAIRIGFLLASWGIIVPYTALQAWVQFADGHWAIGVLFAILSAACTQLYRFSLTDKHRALAQNLGKVDDVRCIGRLAELLEWPDEKVRSIAIAALKRLLPRAKASDRVLRSGAQRASLYRTLTLSNAGQYADFQIKLLRSLEQIGDASAIPHVENLVNARPSTARERSVCEAAEDCLPYLMDRSVLNHSSETLLRASSATATGADMLMRPAGASDIAKPEELLRASTQGGGD